MFTTAVASLSKPDDEQVRYHGGRAFGVEINVGGVPDLDVRASCSDPVVVDLELLRFVVTDTPRCLLESQPRKCSSGVESVRASDGEQADHRATANGLGRAAVHLVSTLIVEALEAQGPVMGLTVRFMMFF
jgi:hypothetical protein